MLSKHSLCDDGVTAARGKGKKNAPKREKIFEHYLFKNLITTIRYIDYLQRAFQ